MTLFEYLAIAFSLVFSFAGMRLVGGLPHAAQTGRRYWIHLSFVCFQLLITVIAFWGFWTYRAVEWNLAKFLLVLAAPGIVYFNACTLIPEIPSAVTSWRDYYYLIRVRYFIGFCCTIVVIFIASLWILEVPLLHPLRIVQVTMFSAAVTGAASRNERVQAGLVVFFFLISLFMWSTALFQPGSFWPA